MRLPDVSDQLPQPRHVPAKDTEVVDSIAIASLLSGFSAQVVKLVLETMKTGKPRPSALLNTGGMPSSHTALVTTLTIGVGKKVGIDSSLFSVTLIFSMYFVFEATGLRQEVGKQARLLNELVDDLLQSHHLNTKRLKEFIGHTWKEVFVGFLVGALVGVLAFY